MTPELRAQSLYPTPTKGNTFDKEDFEFRTLKAEIQRKAFAKGWNESKKVKL